MSSLWIRKRANWGSSSDSGAGPASQSALPRLSMTSYHAEALAQMPKTLAAVIKRVKVVRFVDRQVREQYPSRSSKVLPAKALDGPRRQPLAKGEHQRIAMGVAALAAGSAGLMSAGQRMKIGKLGVAGDNSRR